METANRPQRRVVSHPINYFFDTKGNLVAKLCVICHEMIVDQADEYAAINFANVGDPKRLSEAADLNDGAFGKLFALERFHATPPQLAVLAVDKALNLGLQKLCAQGI